MVELLGAISGSPMGCMWNVPADPRMQRTEAILGWNLANTVALSVRYDASESRYKLTEVYRSTGSEKVSSFSTGSELIQFLNTHYPPRRCQVTNHQYLRQRGGRGECFGQRSSAS